jgi:hypothetical protein
VRIIELAKKTKQEGDKYGKPDWKKISLHKMRQRIHRNQGRRRHNYMLRPTHGNQEIRLFS